MKPVATFNLNTHKKQEKEKKIKKNLSHTWHLWTYLEGIGRNKNDSGLNNETMVNRYFISWGEKAPLSDTVTL